MPFTRPNLTSLRQQARGYFVARLPGADSALRRWTLGVLSDVVAGLVNGLYGFLDWIATLFLPDSCPPDYLARWATIFNRPRKLAIKAAGNIVCTGTVGAPIPQGSLLQGPDPGRWQYATDDAAEIGGPGNVTLQIIAVTGGEGGNLAIGATLTFVSALAGVDATATVADGGLTGGADDEPLAQWRARVLSRMQDPPQGGNANDYAEWAEGVPGVTRAWVYPENRGLGTVDVCFVMDGRSDIIPLDADVAEVQAAIDAVRPITDDFLAFAPTGAAIDLTLSFLAPNSAATRDAITAAWNDLFLDVIPGAGLSFQDQIVPAIAAAAGIAAFTISAPVADVGGIRGTIYTPGVVHFP